ncbi:MAG: ABC transporter ATP-binding protein [Cyanobacteria bacterium J06641_5]
MTLPLLQLDRLSIAYPGSDTWAAHAVSLSLAAGERLGLVGESGCGKSTLGRAILRLLPAGTRTEGDLRLQGQSLQELAANQLQQLRGEAVGLVFQDPMTRLDPLMTVGDHCIETLRSHQPQLSYRQAKVKALETLAAVKIPGDRWQQYPHEFSGGMRQRVAIALALLLEPQLMIADEPTTSLDVTVAAEILQELTRLCQERNLGLLLISHDLALVAEHCDRVAVMYRGQIVETGPARQLLSNPSHEYSRSLVGAALQLCVGAEPGSETIPVVVKVAAESDKAVAAGTHVEPTEPSSSALLQVCDLKTHFTLALNPLQRLLGGRERAIKAVDGVSFELQAREIFGLVGESGCGKSTLARTILQLARATSGRITFQGQELTALSPRQMRPLRRQMQMIFQDPLACLNPRMTVGQAIADPLRIHGLADGAGVRERVWQMLERVGLTPAAAFARRYPKDLSGGQQQRVAIARALISRPQFVICDEPTSMLDVSIQAQVLELMLELKAEFNLTYLFVTHDLSVARYLCDRIAVMHRGQIVELGDTAEVFERPQHPYTQTLLAAAPQLVPETQNLTPAA